MPNRDLIVVGASAGGIEALEDLSRDLPGDLAASLLVVVHMPPTGGPALRRILSRYTGLDVVMARDGEELKPGRMYVAVGDHHLLAGNGTVQVRQGPRENGHRPAVDPLFRSAAAYYGPRAVGVILSGGMSDGTAGLSSIRRQGGIAVVQDPEDALYDGMPRNALETVGADYVLPASEMGSLLARLVAGEMDGPEGDPDDDPVDDSIPPVLHREVEIMRGESELLDQEHPGRPSPWPCPDCNGVLWEIDDGPVLRFRCRVGHAWEAESSSSSRPRGWKGRCGWPSGLWRTGRPLARSWRSGPRWPAAG